MTSQKKKIPINNHHASPGDGSTEPAAAAEAAPEAVSADETPRADAGAAEGDLAGAVGADGQAGAEDADPVEAALLDVVIAERDGYLDALRRLQAEFDNYRRRSQRESTEVRARARCGLLAEFLPVFDNLARALDAAEHHQEGKVLDGVRLTHSLFADLLRREGVEEIHPLGSTFDPHLHEAIVSLPSDEEEGTVVQVVEKGYAAGETVLRPARVAVSAGAPAARAEE